MPIIVEGMRDGVEKTRIKLLLSRFNTKSAAQAEFFYFEIFTQLVGKSFLSTQSLTLGDDAEWGSYNSIYIVMETIYCKMETCSNERNNRASNSDDE